jgi:hypothetical protein
VVEIRAPSLSIIGGGSGADTMNIERKSLHFAFRLEVRLCALTLLGVLVTSCATTSGSRLHPRGAPDGSLILAQVTARFTRDTIVHDQQSYRILLASGIDSAQIRDGSLGLGRINCCGGPTERDTAIGFYIPGDVPAEVDDLVEVRLGRLPQKEGGDAGEANRVTRVVEKSESATSQCRWVPPNRMLWGRVIYCDWMPSEGWVPEGPTGNMMDKAWIKKP